MTELNREDWSTADAATAVEAAAASWLVRMTSGEISAAERAEFQRWRSADPAHEAALAELRGLWAGIGTPLTAAQGRPALAPDVGHAGNAANIAPAMPAARQVRRAPARRRIARWAIAASLLLGITLALQWPAGDAHDLITASGERSRFVLADGSAVTLSGGSALDLDIGSQQRLLTLVRGEVFFDVSHEPDRPFIVDAGSTQIHVLGTRFAVRRDDGAAHVVVEQGRVEVRSGAARSILAAGQRISAGDGETGTIEPADIASDLAWRDGYLVFRDATLADITETVNRHSRKSIGVTGRAGAQRLNAVVELGRVDDWLQGLQATGTAQMLRVGDLILLY